MSAVGKISMASPRPFLNAGGIVDSGVVKDAPGQISGSEMNNVQRVFFLAGCAVAGFIVLASGLTSPARAQTPVDPILYAVLKPGTPPTFARRSGTAGAYELVPTRSVILRLINTPPAIPDAIKIVLRYPFAGESNPLQFVQQDDIPRQRALDQIGFFEVVYDSFGYSVIIVLPQSQRQGPGFFDIVMVNTVPNPPAGTRAESNRLVVGVLPTPERTKPSEVFFDCGPDRHLPGYSLHSNCLPGVSAVMQNFTLEGWLIKSDPNCLGDDLCWEDFHYDFVPNPDFIDSFYGPAGAFAALLGGEPFPNLKLPGHPAQPPGRMLDFRDVSALDGKAKGVTINSFALPGTDDATDSSSHRVTIVTELNAWHVNDQFVFSPGSFSVQGWRGRGPAPNGWVSNLVPSEDRYYEAWSNTRWPFVPGNPDGGSYPLTPGDHYVRVNGTLFQDLEHGGGPRALSGAQWERALPGHAGWIEIHPVDWIERSPLPSRRKTPILVEFIPVPGAPAQKVVSFAPESDPLPGQVLRCRELIDGRYTNLPSITRRVTVSASNVTVAVFPNGPTPRFKAVYLTWWETGTAADTTCSPA